MSTNRREFLLGLGSLTAVSTLSMGEAHGMGEARVGIARLSIPGLPDPRPGAIAALMEEVASNSSILTSRDVHNVAPGAVELFKHPFVVLTGDKGFDPLPDEAVANLRLYVREGGFLFIDDASGIRDSAFDLSVRRHLLRVLPGAELARIGREHAVYRSFFLMRGAVGRIMVRPYLEGLWVGDITPILYSSNDLFGAWMRAGDGGYALEVVPGGETQRTQARRLGLNVVEFALTSNYKRDVVHVRSLMEKMRRQGGYGE